MRIQIMKTNTSRYLAALTVTFAAIAGSAIAADFNPQFDPPGKTQKGDAAMHNSPTDSGATPAEKCGHNPLGERVVKNTETPTATELKQLTRDKKLNAPPLDASACAKK
jgi:hypothetical protein